MQADAKTDVDLIAAARAAFARFEGPRPGGGRDDESRLRWVDALLDGEDDERAAAELHGMLTGHELSAGFDRVATRLRGHERRRTLAQAVLDSGWASGPYESPWSVPRRSVAATVVRLADGDQGLEEAALRKALAWDPGFMLDPPHPAGPVVAALAEQRRDEPAYLDHLAGLLAGDDRAHLAYAAALLGPLGLDETLRRCGTVEDGAGEALTAAFADAGRFDEALAFAVTLGPEARQHALLRLAAPGLPEAREKALVAAYRKTPRASRKRDDQVFHRSRLIRLLLALDRVDEALTELAQLPDTRYTDRGPAAHAMALLRRFAERPAEATPARLRAVLDVLTGRHVHAQDLNEVVVEAVRLLHRLGDAPFRAELVAAGVPRLRDHLQSWGRFAGFGLAWARVDDGDHVAADPLFTSVTDPFGLRILLRMAPGARLASRNPALLASLLTTAFSGVVRFPFDGYGPDELRLVAEALPSAPYEYPRWMGVLIARYAADVGDRRLLAVALETAPDPEALRKVAHDVAVLLARTGQTADAVEIAS